MKNVSFKTLNVAKVYTVQSTWKYKNTISSVERNKYIKTHPRKEQKNMNEFTVKRKIELT